MYAIKLARNGHKPIPLTDGNIGVKRNEISVNGANCTITSCKHANIIYEIVAAKRDLAHIFPSFQIIRDTSVLYIRTGKQCVHHGVTVA